jgi:hypothetical protein
MKTQNKANLLNAALVVACLGSALGCGVIKNLAGGQKNGNQSAPTIASNSGSPYVLDAPTSKPFPVSPNEKISAEFLKFAPVQVGVSVGKIAFALEPDKGDFVDGARFVYESKDYNTYFVVAKYPTAEAASAAVKKNVSSAVPTAEYDKKVKMPKCDKNKETDYETPWEFIKTLPVKTGGEAYVQHAGKIWDYECKVDDRYRDEYIVWSNGIYYFSIDSTGTYTQTGAFGKAEAFFYDYQNAAGQR